MLHATMGFNRASITIHGEFLIAHEVNLITYMNLKDKIFDTEDNDVIGHELVFGNDDDEWNLEMQAI